MGKDVDRRSASPTDKESGRELSIGRFAEARAAELHHFEETLRTKHLQTTRTPMQTVAKHMRRRAMSHNRFRIPSRIRALNGKYLKDSESKVLRCRKHARNSRLILLHYFKRSLKPSAEGQERSSLLSHKWLETHLWHARRMQMSLFCGYKIALRSRQKQIRTVAAFSRHHCVLYDKSYFCTLRLSCLDPGAFLARLGKIKRGKDRDCLELFVDDDLPDVTCLKGSSSTLILICLTSLGASLEAKAKAVAAENSISLEVVDISDSLNIFEAIGPRSTEVIFNALQDCADASAGGFFDCLREAGICPPAYFPTMQSYSLECQYKRERDISEQNPIRPLVLQPPPPLPEFLPSLFLSKLPKTQRAVETFIQALQTVGPLAYLQRFLEARRGQYTHKRVKQTPKDGQALLLSNTEASTFPRHTPESMNQEPIGEDELHVKSLMKRIKEEEFQKFQVLLINTSNRSIDLNRFLILVPSGFGKRLWRKLNLVGGKAMGLTEYNHAQHQFGLPIFPKDYPESKAFATSEAEQKEKSILKFFRVPPAKRPNYYKLRSPFPFSCDFSKLQNSLDDFRSKYSKIRMVSLHGSIPVDFGYICYPLETDVLSLLAEYQTSGRLEASIFNTKQPELKSSLHENQLIEVESTKELTRDEYLSSLETPALFTSDRKVIGRITSGFLHFGLARGYGFGAIDKDDFFRLREITDHLRTLKSANHLHLEAGCAVALFRNPASDCLHFATLTLIDS